MNRPDPVNAALCRRLLAARMARSFYTIAEATRENLLAQLAADRRCRSLKRVLEERLQAQTQLARAA